MLLNLVIRAWRWQYLLEPLGKASFANSFRATAVGFAASSFLPAARRRGHPALLPVAARADERDRRVRHDRHRAAARHDHRARPARVVRVRVRPRRRACQPGRVRGGEVGRRRRRRDLAVRARRAVRAGRQSGAARGDVPASGAGAAVRVRGAARPHRREVRDRPRRDPAAGPAGRDAVLVVSARGCASRSASGRWPGRSVSTCRSPARF